MKTATKIFLLTMLLLCMLVLKPYAQPATGNAVIDAVTLSQKLDAYKTAPTESLKNEIIALLEANLSESGTSNDVISNHFLDTAVLAVLGRGVGIEGKGLPLVEETGKSQAFHALGGTNIPDVLATFIATRFKQEVEIAFIDKFRTLLLKPTPDLKLASQVFNALFPTTADVLIKNDPYQYTTFLETLKEAMNKDVNNLPAGVGNWLSSNPFGFPADSYYFPALSVYNCLLNILNNHSPVAAINSLANDSLLNKATGNAANVAAALKFFSAVSNTLTNPADRTKWLDISNIQSSLNSPKTRQLFIGLFILKYKNVLTGLKIGNKDLYTAINGSASKSEEIFSWIMAVASQYNNLSIQYADLVRSFNTHTRLSSAQIRNISGALSATVNLISSFPFTDIGISSFDITTAGLEKITATITGLTKISEELADSNYGLALMDVLAIIGMYTQDAKTINTVKKYGNFAVSVVKSKGKEDMLDALDAAALPVGSYRIKRNSYENISLNAFAGIFGGTEWYPSTIPANVTRFGFNTGFTAPLGIAYSWGSQYREKPKTDSLTETSNTIFLSVLDVGAVTAFRLTHDSTATLPEFKFRNVIAPGLYYVYGFKRMPLSLGVGGQYGPQLRSLKSGEATTLPSAISFRVFAAIDIPFVNFYTRTEKKMK